MSTVAAELHTPPSGTSLLTDKPSGSRAFKNALATVLVTIAFIIALIPLLWILYTVISRGAGLLADSNWWSQSQRGITTRREGGGAYHAILGSLLQAGVTALMSVPIGILTAIYLVEYGRGRLAKVVSFMVDILTGVPSIVAGLFIYAVWVTTFGFQRVGFAVCLALVLLMVPVVVRSTEEMLKLVPERAARGVVRAGGAEVEDHREHRAADSPVGDRDRCHAGTGPGHG
jgi:phosphate transport system permease protein